MKKNVYVRYIYISLQTKSNHVIWLNLSTILFKSSISLNFTKFPNAREKEIPLLNK